MKDHDSPPIDWDSIFTRAHRHITSRLILLGALTMLCTLLLLGGGLSAQGALPLGSELSKKEKGANTKPDDDGRKPDATENGGPGGDGKEKSGDRGRRDGQPTGVDGNGDGDPSEDCPDLEDSGGTEYLDAPPEGVEQSGEECDSGTGGTGAEEDGASSSPSQATD